MISDFEMIIFENTSMQNPKASGLLFMPKQIAVIPRSIILSVLIVMALGTVSQLDARSGENRFSETDLLVESCRLDHPVTFCGVQFPMDRPGIRERMEKELLLSLWDRPQVILWMKRASRFFPHIEPILREHGVPDDVKYIALVESALRPHARSSKRAVGYWQFLRRTGLRYGLRIDRMVDERRNLFESTHAACRYLKELERKFDSWLLALSAYNMGDYALRKEIRAQEASEYFSLYLPQQTERYLFKAASIKLILENPKKYGFDMETTDHYPVFNFDRVNLDTDFQLPITLIARVAQVPFRTIKEYNPHFRGYYLPRGKLEILIPKGSAKGFEARFKSEYAQWEKTASRRSHIVRRGESLSLIAQKYRISFSKLLELNNLSPKKVIHPGDKLWVE